MPIPVREPYCVSITYEDLIGFEEEDNDIKFTGNYAIRGVQHPPLIVHILLYRRIDFNKSSLSSSSHSVLLYFIFLDTEYCLRLLCNAKLQIFYERQSESLVKIS